MSGIQEVLRLVLMATAVVGYYWIVVDKLGALSRPLVDVTGLARRYPSRDISAVINLPLAGLSQAAFFLVLLTLTGIQSVAFVGRGFQSVLLLYGVLLGIADMALSTFLCNVGIHVANEIAPRGSPADLSEWLVIARGGWMRYYLRTIDLAPLPVALLSILLYVAIEEIVFRGLLINYFAPLGAVAAVILSTLLFAAVQVFHMPGWRSAMFPVIGALVVGVLHGALFIAVPNVIPLIIAHLVFLIVAVV